MHDHGLAFQPRKELDWHDGAEIGCVTKALIRLGSRKRVLFRLLCSSLPCFVGSQVTRVHASPNIFCQLKDSNSANGLRLCNKHILSLIQGIVAICVSSLRCMSANARGRIGPGHCSDTVWVAHVSHALVAVMLKPALVATRSMS